MGTSLTAGYGLNDPTDGFTSLIQMMVDSLALPFEIVNAGVSGETSAGGIRRVRWLFDRPTAVFVLELGANDGLRGQAPSLMQINLQAIIDRVRERYPAVKLVIAGMEAPPNMGSQYVQEFRDVFPDLAAANDALLIPFLLDGVAGVTALNQRDGIHPNPAGHRRVAATVWNIIEPLLVELTGGLEATDSGTDGGQP
ncbi:MAG: arylesterase [Gemmatimonadota bacterium]|nr:MAG: arylesterase [Gemmatimonadota bacterium]